MDHRHAEDATRREEKNRTEVIMGQKRQKDAEMTRTSWDSAK